MATRLITAPATEPITTAEAKAHLRVTSSAEDTLIDALVKAVRMTAEHDLQRALITQVWEVTLDAFPLEIELPYPPTISVDFVKYLEPVAGVLTTLSSAAYSLDAKSEPGWIVPAFDYDWPDTLDAINAVTVQYQAGYGAAAAVPQAIKQWMLLMVGHYFENREASMPAVTTTPLPFIAGLLDPFRIMRVY